MLCALLREISWIRFLLKFQNSKKNSKKNKPNFLKLWILNNLGKVFPVRLLVFNFDGFSEGPAAKSQLQAFELTLILVSFFC
jgi:hypothetical protein